MILRKVALITSAASALLLAQPSMAASCSVDKAQMYQQIYRYDSISTVGCRWNYMHNVYSEEQSGENTCTAVCSSYGITSRPCSWEMGNWGDTLTCQY